MGISGPRLGRRIRRTAAASAAVILRVAAILLTAPAFAALQGPSLHTILIAGVPVELSYRALEPGEVILVKPRPDPSVLRVDVRLRTQKRRIDYDGKSRPVLLGIDVGAKPQAYFMEFTTVRRDGSKETVFKKLPVGSKEFPKTNLTVDPGMVEAPPEETERIRREAALVADVLGSVSPEWLGSGPFVSPLPENEPFPNFGQRRMYNGKTASVHTGVDISAAAGTEARASNSGRVVLATELYFSGKTVIIDHGLGVFTYYGHFSKLRVKRGDRVNKGDVIAEVGSTGRSTGPHLHWSVRLLDSRVDPFSLAALPLD
jgi:biotin carboxyl carrier protein